MDEQNDAAGERPADRRAGSSAGPDGGGGPAAQWWAEGLLFENCNCTAVCPGHVHFSQPCTHDVCHGFWAIRFARGAYGGAGGQSVDLAGVDAVVVYEAPQVMIEGGWTQGLVVSDRASAAQVRAVEAILEGKQGGPWSVLSGFVGERTATKTAPVRIEDAPGRKAVTVAGILEGAIEAVRGRDRSRPVTFENIYNQIHDARQVIARGSTRCDQEDIVVRNEGTHGLWSRFRWTGP